MSRLSLISYPGQVDRLFPDDFNEQDIDYFQLILPRYSSMVKGATFGFNLVTTAL